MAAVFQWREDNGASGTSTASVSQVNWKNIDDVASNYQSFPITAGNNSYSKYQYGMFVSGYSQVSNGFFDHTAGALGTSFQLCCQPSMTGDGDKLSYVQPAVAVNTSLTGTITAVNASFPTSALVVWFATTSPTETMVSSTTGAPAYTNYLCTQLRVAADAQPGDLTNTVTLTLRYDEN